MTNRKVTEGFRWQDQRDAINTFLNMCFSKISLGSGAGFGASCLYNMVVCIEGYIYSFGQASMALSSYNAISTASNYARLIALTVNSAGSFSWIPGSAVSLGAAAYFPESGIPASRAVVGFIRISGASTSHVNFGSNSLGGMGIEYFDVCQIPQGVIIET